MKKIKFSFLRKTEENDLIFRCACKKTQEEKSHDKKNEVDDLQEDSSPPPSKKKSSKDKNKKTNLKEEKEEKTIKKSKIEKESSNTSSISDSGSFDPEADFLDSEEEIEEQKKDKDFIVDTEKNPVKLTKDELQELHGSKMKHLPEYQKAAKQAKEMESDDESDDSQTSFVVKKKDKSKKKNGQYDCPGYGVNYKLFLKENSSAVEMMTCPVFIWTVMIVQNENQTGWIVQEVLEVETYNKKTEVNFGMIKNQLVKIDAPTKEKNILEAFIKHKKANTKSSCTEENTIVDNEKHYSIRIYLKLCSVEIEKILPYLEFCFFFSSDYKTYIEYKDLIDIDKIKEIDDCLEDADLIDLLWNLIKKSIPQANLYKIKNPILSDLLIFYNRIYSPLIKDKFDSEVIKENSNENFSEFLLNMIKADPQFICSLNQETGKHEIVLQKKDNELKIVKNNLFGENTYNYNVQRVEDMNSKIYFSSLTKLITQTFRFKDFILVTPSEDRKLLISDKIGNISLITFSELRDANERPSSKIQNRLRIIIDSAHLFDPTQISEIIESTKKKSPRLKDIYIFGSQFSPYKIQHNVMVTFKSLYDSKKPGVEYSTLNNNIAVSDKTVEFKTKKELIQHVSSNYDKTFHIFFHNGEVKKKMDLSTNLKNIQEHTMTSWYEGKKMYSFEHSIVVLKECTPQTFVLNCNAAGSDRIFLCEEKGDNNNVNPTSLNKKIIEPIKQNNILSKIILQN